MPETAARTDLARAQAERLRNPIVAAKTPEEIAKLKAQTFQARMAGKLSETKATEITRLLDEKEEAERLGNQQKIADLNSNLEVLFGEDKALVPAKDVLAEMGRQARAGAPGDTLAREKFELQQELTGPEIEEEILRKPKSSQSLARYQEFNRFSNRPKIAINDDGKVKFIALGKVGGKVVTARQVNEAAGELGMTVDELYIVSKQAGISVLEYLQAIQSAIQQQKQ